MVESFLSGEGRRVVVMVLQTGEMISFGVGSFGGWRYWGDRVGGVGRFFSRRPVYGTIANWCAR